MKRELENQLWEKFYAGLTTPDEERALLEHPAAPDDAPQRTADRQLLAWLAEPDEATLPEGFQGRLRAALGPAAAPRRRRHRLRLWLPYTAAALFAGVLFGLHFLPGTKPAGYADTCMNTLQSMQESEEILLYVSEQLNTAMDEDDLGGPCD